MTTTDYDCQTCGACCFSPWTADGYVRLYTIDVERLHGTGLPIILQEQGDPGQSEVLTKLGTKLDAQSRRSCAAFEGDLGQACSCSIYSDRPEACRHYEVGGLLCREARRCFGMPL